MQHVDVWKKRPARWPWLLGLALLVMVLWGVTVLLGTDPAPEPPAAVTTPADSLPPAMIPFDSRGTAPANAVPTDAAPADDTAADGAAVVDDAADDTPADGGG